MARENYLLTNTALLIEDEEMQISLHLPFDLPRLPAKLQEAGGDLCLEREPSGSVSAAYLTAGGKKQGECRYFYPRGQVKAEMFYQSGVLHGPSIFYSENGHLLAKTWYVQGKKMGKVRYFYLSGAQASVQRYKEGLYEGLQEYWYEGGQVKSLLPYSRGAIEGEVRLFWESGICKRSVHYSRGVREGWDRLWNEKGILIDAGAYSQGEPIGEHSHFFSEGQVREVIYYHTPERFDCRQWNAKGELLMEGIYASDLTYVERKFTDGRIAQVREGYWNGQRLCWK